MGDMPSYRMVTLFTMVTMKYRGGYHVITMWLPCDYHDYYTCLCNVSMATAPASCSLELDLASLLAVMGLE